MISSCRASRRTAPRRRLLDGSQLRAHFGERNARGDIGQRAQLDGPDQSLEHVAEQLDLLAGIAISLQQEQVGNPANRLDMFFRRTGRNGRIDFVGNGFFQHRSS